MVDNHGILRGINVSILVLLITSVLINIWQYRRIYRLEDLVLRKIDKEHQEGILEEDDDD